MEIDGCKYPVTIMRLLNFRIRMFVKSAVITGDVIPIPVLGGTNESSRIKDDYKQKLDFYLKLIRR